MLYYKEFKIDEANFDDIDSIYNILAPYVEKGLILKRNKTEIKKNISTFLVGKINNRIIGTISYHTYSWNLCEIRSLAVDSDFSKLGLGTKLLQSLIKKLNVNEIINIFSLSYSPDFFIKNGFQKTSMENLPEKIWKDCIYCKHRDTCAETALLYNK